MVGFCIDLTTTLPDMSCQQNLLVLICLDFIEELFVAGFLSTFMFMPFF